MIKLNITIQQDTVTPNRWAAVCATLDVIGDGSSPEDALEALAGAIGSVVEHTALRQGISSEQAFSVLAAAARPCAGDERDAKISELEGRLENERAAFVRTHKVLCERNGEINDLKNQNAALLKALGDKHVAEQVPTAVIEEVLRNAKDHAVRALLDAFAAPHAHDVTAAWDRATYLYGRTHLNFVRITPTTVIEALEQLHKDAVAWWRCSLNPSVAASYLKPVDDRLAEILKLARGES